MALVNYSDSETSDTELAQVYADQVTATSGGDVSARVVSGSGVNSNSASGNDTMSTGVSAAANGPAANGSAMNSNATSTNATAIARASTAAVEIASEEDDDDDDNESDLDIDEYGYNKYDRQVFEELDSILDGENVNGMTWEDFWDYVEPELDVSHYCELYVDAESLAWNYWWYRAFPGPDVSFLHESVWLNPYRRPSRHDIDYSNFGASDLKRFVVQRRLKDPFPQGVTLKTYYIPLLIKADKELSFRIMDLPLEMRVNVYRNLLIFHDGPFCSRVYPTILRTSKEVYKEAKDVLYGDNIFEAAFQVDGLDHGVSQRHAHVHNTCSAPSCAHAVHAKFFRTPEGIDDYPEFFRHISHLKVHLKHAITGTTHILGDAEWPMSNYLFTLASFLMDGHRLKSLTLEFDMPPEFERYKYESMLYPLLRLRNISKVTIKGNLPDYVQKKLIQELKGHEPAFNTMRHWKHLKDEAHSYLNLISAVDGEAQCDCGECPVSENAEEVCDLLNGLVEAKDECCFDSALEENMLARLGSLQRVLKYKSPRDILQVAKDWNDKRNTTLRYNLVSDDGRLDEAMTIWSGKIWNQARYEVARNVDDWDKPEDYVSDSEDGDTAKATAATSKWGV